MSEDRIDLETAIQQLTSTPLIRFRERFPEYDDLTDQQLTDKVYSRFYSDMPRAEFDAKIKASGALPGELPGKEQVTIAEQFRADWPRRRQALALILLPPLGVLVVGIGLFWAAQGFRKLA